MSPINILVMFFFALQISLSYSKTIKVVDLNHERFECQKDYPVTKNRYYSNTPVKVDLIHIFCGQIFMDRKSGTHTAFGFHARPNGRDPVTAHVDKHQIKQKGDGNEWTSYTNVKVLDTAGKEEVFLTKPFSSFWPTDMSMKEIVNEVSKMVTECK